MPSHVSAQSWLQRVHHDLVKRVLWRARDYRALGQPPPPGGLMTECINDEGDTVTCQECWRSLRVDAPAELPLDDFEHALQHSLLAAAHDDLEGVLVLEPAFQRLAKQVNSTPG